MFYRITLAKGEFTMKDVFICLQENPYIWLILSIISVIGFVIATVDSVKARLKMQISYYSQSYILAQNSSHFKEYQIHYNSEKYNKVTLTKYVIWNNRNKTIHSDDVTKTRSISIYTSNDKVKILDAKIICCDESNCFEIKSVEDKKITLSFDYMAKHDGVVVAILHTGNDKDLEFDYKLKNSARKVNRGSLYAMKGDVGVASGYLLKLLGSFLFLLAYKKHNLENLTYKNYLLVAIGCLPFICLFIIILVSFGRIPKRLRDAPIF